MHSGIWGYAVLDLVVKEKHNNFDMLNDKMVSAKFAIKDVLTAALLSNYSASPLSEKVTIDDLAVQIMFECSKYAFEYSLPRHSLRYYLQQSGSIEDDQRLLIQRTLKKVNTYRIAEYDIIKQQFGIELDNLLPKRMDNMSNKLSGYEFTPFQFWEIQNIHDMKLVDDIISGKISKKNFNQEAFKSSAAEYDKIIGDLLNQSQQSDSDKVFAILALFTIEWKYSFDFYYSVVSEMEILKISSIPDLERRCSLFCGRIAVCPSFSHMCIHTDSRLLHVRQRFVHEFVTYDVHDFRQLEHQYAEVIAVCSLVHHRFDKWFVENTSLADWISVLDEYHIDSCFVPNKKWSSKKIRYMKEIYKSTYTDIENPDFRS